MKSIKTLICLIFLSTLLSGQTYDWPTETDNTHNTNRIVGTVGEFRGTRAQGSEGLSSY